MVILQNEVPDQGNHCGHRGKADGEPAQSKTGCKKHHNEDEEENQRRAKVARGDNDDAENQDKVRNDLRGRHGIIESARASLQCGNLFGKDDGEGELDNLRRLDADAEKAVPCLVAGAVIMTENDEAGDEYNIEDREDHPFVCKDVHVQNGHDDECADAEEHTQRLHNDIFSGSGIRGRCAGDNDDAEHGADDAQSQQKQIRSLKEFPNRGAKPLHLQQPPFCLISRLKIITQKTELRNARIVNKHKGRSARIRIDVLIM